MPTVPELYASLHPPTSDLGSPTSDPSDPIAAFHSVTPDASPLERDALAREAARSAFGIDSPDGSAFHPDRQPLPRGQYYETVKRIFTDGLTALDTPDLTAWKALDPSDRPARLSAAQAARSAWSSFSDKAGTALSEAFTVPELADGQDPEQARAARQTEAEDRLIADHEADLLSQNWLARFKAIEPDLSDTAKAIVKSAAETGAGISEQHLADFMALPQDQADRVSYLARASMPAAARNAWKDAALDTTDMAERLGLNLATFGARAGEALNDMGQPTRSLPFEAIDPALKQEVDRRHRLLRDTNARKPYEGYNAVQEALMGAAATIPYMAVAAIPVVGQAAVTVDQFESVRARILRDGGNPDEAALAQAAAAVAYAYVEKLSWSSAFGKPMSTLARRQLFMNLSRGGYAIAARQAGLEFTLSSATETAEEMIQQALEEVSVGTAELDPDTLKKTLSGFISQAGTIGTMAVIGGLGTGAKALRSNSARLTQEDLADFATRQLKVSSILAPPAGLVLPGTDKAQQSKRATAIADARRAWFTPPSLHQGLAALQELGYTREQAATLADYLDAERALSAPRLSRPRYLAQNTLDVPAAITRLIPGAVVESLPVVSGQSSEVSTAPTSDLRPLTSPPPSEPAATLTLKQRRNGRTTVREVPNPAHAEWLANQKSEVSGQTSAPAAPTSDLRPPTSSTAPVSAYRVTLPSGSVYTVETGPQSVDTSTTTFATSVQQATSGAVRAADYLAMTPAEQAAVITAHGLQSRGTFQLRRNPEVSGQTSEVSTDPTSDLRPPTSSLSSEGLIRLVTPGAYDPATAPASDFTYFHEHAHAAVSLAREAGTLTPEQASTLRSLFGDAVNPGELFNEEAAADAFAEWASGLAEDHPAAGAFAAIRAFIERLLRALGLLPDRSTLSREAAAREAAFTSMRSGSFAPLDPYAGITLVSSQPEPASPASEPPATPSPVPAQASAASQAPATPSQPTAPIAPVAPPQPSQPAGPRALTLHTPTGGLTFQATWQWVPRADLVDSENPRYPQKYQPRDRNRVASMQQIHRDSRPGVFSFARLTDSVESDGGSPITAGDNVILSGNGRKGMLDALAREGRLDAEYVQPITQWAAERGIPTPPAGMAEPILVRRITSVTGAQADDTLKKIAELSNRPKILQRSEAELAEADARLLTPSLLGLYSPGSGGNLLAQSNAPFMQAFIKAAGAEGDVDSKGRPTAALATRVQQAMLAAVIGTDEQARALIRTLIEREPKLALATLYNDLIDHAGETIDVGLTIPTLSLTGHLRDAVRRYIGWRSSGSASLADHLAMPDFTEAPVSPEAAAIMRLTAAGRLGPVLARYATLARQQGANTAALFEGHDRSPLQLLSIADRDTLAEGEAPSTPDLLEISSQPSAVSGQRSAVSGQPLFPATPSQPPNVQTPPPSNVPLPYPAPASAAKPAASPATPIPEPTPAALAALPPLGHVSLVKTLDTTPLPEAVRLAERWSPIMPGFQGNKGSMAAPALSAILRAFTPQARAGYDTLADYFGGGGNWGIFLSLAAFPNIKNALIYERNANRLLKIRLFHERGHEVAALLDSPAFKSEVLDLATSAMADDSVTSGSALAARLDKIPVASDLSRALRQALIDYASNSYGAKEDEQGNATGAAKMAMAVRLVGEQAAQARAGAQAFTARGGSIAYRNEDSYKAAQTPGPNVLSVIDPPYYKTKGYSYTATVSDLFGTHEETVTEPDVGIDTYQATRDLLKRCADASNGIVYTDSAWWPKEYAALPDGLKPQYDREGQKVVASMLDFLDRYDIVDGDIGKDRNEVLGVHYGNRTDATEADRLNLGKRTQPRDLVPARREPAQRPDAPGRPLPDLQDPALQPVAGGDAGSPAPLRSGDDRLVPRHSVTASARASEASDRSPALAAFLRGSKVKTVVYHGTAGDFSIFPADGAWFADDPELASAYAKNAGLDAGGGANVMPVHVSLKNPRYVNVTDWPKVNHATTNAAAEDAVKRGYDGAILFSDWEDVGTLYFVATPAQIKSATGNRGTFSPTDPDIRHHVTASRRDPGAAAEAILAAQIIAGEPVTVAQAERLVKNAGLKDEDPAALLAAATARARSSEATVLAAAKLADRDLIDRLADAADRDRYEQRVTKTFSQGAAYAGAGTDAALSLERAREKAVRRDIDTAAGYTAAEMQAELGVDLSAAVLSTPDIQPTAEEIARRQLERERAQAEDALADDPASPAAAVPPSPTMQALLAEILASAYARSEADRLEAQRRALADKQRANQSDASDSEASPDPSQPTAPDAPIALPSYQLIAPALNNPEDFAAFVYEWATRRIRADRPELDPARLYSHPAALRDLQRTAQDILSGLAQDLLGTGQARVQATRDIAGLTDNKTARATVRDIAYIYSRLHAAALRTSREDLVDALERDVKRLAVEPGRFLSQREDLKRRVTAKVEVFARTLISYLRLDPTAIAAEDRRLTKILENYTLSPEDADTAVPEAAQQAAADQLAVLRVYGGMIRWMPGQIADAADAIRADLSGKRAAFEAARIERQERASSILKRLTGGLMRDPAHLQPQPGTLAAYADANMGNLQLRLQHAVRNSTGKLHTDALAAIQDLMVLIGEGETDLLNTMNEGRAAAAQALKDCYGSSRAGVKRLDTPIPAEAQAALSRQGVPLTYGQALQLYGQLIQRDYAPNVQANKRAGDIAVLRTVLDSRDLRLHASLVRWYAEALPRLSAAQEAVTGLPMLSTGPHYTPARLYLDPHDFPAKVRAWSPIPATLTPRVKNTRDFNESRDILGVFAEALDKNSRFLAWGQRGIALRDIIGSSTLQGTLERFNGPAERKALVAQVTDILTGTEARSDAALSAATKARHWTSLLFMSGNISSMLKQLSSIPAFANVVGFRRTGRYLTHIDPAAIRDLAASPGFRARYGTGWSDATAEILADHNRSLPAKALALGLTPIGLMDKFVSLWFGQGYYRDLRATFTDQGYTPEEAKARALTIVTNIVEQTQQSGRASNLTDFQRNGGPAARLLLQFVTAPLQQMQFEIEAVREFHAGTPGSRARLARALIINHLLCPAILGLIGSAWSALLGKPPPDDDDRWREALVSVILGQYGALFLVGQFAEDGLTILAGGRPKFGQGAGIPAAALGPILIQAGATARTAVRWIGPDFLTPSDLAEVTSADLLADLDKLAQRTLPAYRHARQAYDNRQE